MNNTSDTPTEYLRRNLVVAKACGLKHGIEATTQRLHKMHRVPKWLLASLAAMHERASDLPHELAQWRDFSPDSPFPSSTISRGANAIPESLSMKTYYYVYRALLAPKVKHGTFAEAIAEAERLAAANPNIEFEILQAVAVSKTVVAPVQTQMLMGPDGAATGVGSGNS